MTKPQLVTLAPGTFILAVSSEISADGAISFSNEPAFVLVYGPNGTSVLGLLDHEFPLGIHKRDHVLTAFSLLPPGVEPEQVEAHVAETYRSLFAKDNPLPAPFPPEQELDERPPPPEFADIPVGRPSNSSPLDEPAQ